ncbi:hypothetical protein OPV22_028544 [Ensete ventricosum]|uniref:Uncharacterized protein n=1 Tax=Ensete ventricosum TaxID=4639 RepID=A0AAV8P470_ENSVE|nr:hypothetical protein OPV22_028544 [Ensete ventricosum]
MSSSRTMMKPVQLLQFSLNCSRDVSSSLFGRGAVQPFHWIRSGREMMPERTDLGGSRMAARGTWKGLELAVLPLSDVAGRRRSTEFRTYPPNEDCTKFPVEKRGDGRLMTAMVTTMDKGGYVVLDIDNITQPPEKCYTGSPKMTKALSRKGSNRMEKRTSDEQEADDETKKLVAKAASSQLEQLKQSLLTSKSLTTAQSAANAPMLLDSGEGHKRLNRLSVIHPHRVLLVFATM